MAQFFSTIGRHLECAIQTELVVELELALIERKQSRRPSPVVFHKAPLCGLCSSYYTLTIYLAV